MLAGDTVKVVPGGMTPLGQQCVVVTHARHPLPARRVGGFVPQSLNDVFDVEHAPDRRAVQIHEDLEDACAREMAVGIDEAGQQRPPTEIDHARAVLSPLSQLCLASHGCDARAVHAEGLDHAVRGVHGEDGASHVQGAAGSTCKEPDQGNQHEDGQQKKTDPRPLGSAHPAIITRMLQES